MDYTPREPEGSVCTSAEVPSLSSTHCTPGLSEHPPPESVDASEPRLRAVFNTPPAQRGNLDSICSQLLSQNAALVLRDAGVLIK